MRCAPGYQGLSRNCPRNGKRVRARHNATGLSWEGGASSLVSPETGLRRHAEVLRGCGAGAGIGGLLIPPLGAPIFIERLSVMRDLMGGRNARYAQPNCLLKQDRLSAPTQQTFGPPVAVASLSNDAAFEIGSAGLALWLMPHAGCATRDELEKIVDAHRDGFRQRLQARPSAVAEFVRPSVAVCLPTHVDTRQHVALNQAKPYLAGHLARRFYPRQTPVETLIEEGFVLIGTPAHVRQSLAWYQEIGITEVMTMHAFGGMPGSVVQASMRKYAERVSSLVSGQSAESSGESA